MSSQLPLSSLPPTFQEDGGPAQFLDWMQSQMDELFGDPHLVLTPKRHEWVKTISNVLTVLSLPSPVELPWATLHEQNKFAEVSLLLVYHASRRVPSLFAGETVLAQALFSAITNLCATLDLWIDVDVPDEIDYLNPSQLYTKATAAAAALMQSLGNEVLPQASPKAHGIVSDLLRRYLGLVNGASNIRFKLRVLIIPEELLWPSEDIEFPKTIELCTTEEVVKSLSAASKVLTIVGFLYAYSRMLCRAVKSIFLRHHKCC